MSPPVRARDLFLLYGAAHGDVAALRGFHLEVRPNEVVALLGPTGAGKSTLLNLCAGLLRPSSGELTVLGTGLAHAPRGTIETLRRTSIGIVRQHYHRSLPAELTVEEIVELPLRLLGQRGSAPRARVAGLLRAAGLARHARARSTELSGGEQQRVAVCAALAKRPALLLADEPTGELDERTSALVVELLLELAKDAGAAALLATHDPLVSAASERTIHVRDGRVSGEGAAALVVDEHGWLRLPSRLREEAGVQERVRARASWGRIELVPEEARRSPRPAAQEARGGDGAVAPQAASVSVTGVSKSFGRGERSSHVLRDLSWTLEGGGLHVVSGPSGSGKTTLLYLLAALEHPDEGSIVAAGEAIDGLDPEAAAAWRRRTIGYVSQHSTLVGFLTVLENVELALVLRDVPAADRPRRAADTLRSLGLEGLAARRAERLSGGEHRRVALARALAPQPRILLGDEPTAHLDRASGRGVVRLLRQAVRETNLTVIAATHDPDVLEAADSVLPLAMASEQEALTPLRG